MYYIAKIQYLENQDSGKLKRKSESFLMEALSVTEAEAKILEWLPSNWQDPKLKGVNQSNIADINWGENEELWFRAKVAYMDGEEKSKAFAVLVESTDIRNAIVKLEKLYNASWISEISETTLIVDKDLTEVKIEKESV